MKHDLHKACLETISRKIQHLQKVLADLKESSANETKSTAGDKHETALAMLQIEQVNVNAQLHQLLEQKAVLHKIDPGLDTICVVNGSLVQTNHAKFYISVALGKITVDGEVVFCISIQSPIGKKIAGRAPGDTFELNNINYIIERLC